MFRRRISSGLISCFSLPSFTHEHVFQCKLFFHNVSQRMQAWWVSCPLPCLYPQQPGPHCLCIQGGSLQKVYSLGGEHSHGGFLSGNSVQHWLSTKSDLPISPPNPSNLHVLPRDLLQGGGHDLCRSGQDDPHFRGQVEASWEDVKAFDHRGRPQQRLWILLPSALQVKVAHRDINLVPLHPAGWRQSSLFSHLSGNRYPGSGSIPEQPDPESFGIWLRPF